MANASHVKLAAVFILFLCWVVSAQEVQTTVETDDDFECGKTYQPLLKINVSVWNLRSKAFVVDLDHNDFDIWVEGERRPVDYFFKPDPLAFGDARNSFTIEFTLQDWEKDDWRKLAVKVKMRNQPESTVVTATPVGVVFP